MNLATTEQIPPIDRSMGSLKLLKWAAIATYALQSASPLFFSPVAFFEPAISPLDVRTYDFEVETGPVGRIP